MQTTLTSKGQMTLPYAIREQLGFRAGDKLLVTVTDTNTIMLKRQASQPLSALRGLLPKPVKAFSIEQMNTSVATHLKSKHKLSKS